MSQVTAARVTRASIGRGLVGTARPWQWAKNLLVFAAPAAAGILARPQVAVRSLETFLVFCVAASGTYCLNDVIDADRDRADPSRRHRPIASGAVPVRVATEVGVGLLVASVLLAATVANWRLFGVVTIYVLLQPLYSLWLKHVRLVDLAVVSAGFALRATAGAVSVGLVPSHPFLVVVASAALFVTTGKRLAAVGPGSGSGMYSQRFLRALGLAAFSITVAAYSLWVLSQLVRSSPTPWSFELSVIPFVLALLRYDSLADAGLGRSPEELLLRDRALLALGVVWGVLFLVGVYAR